MPQYCAYPWRHLVSRPNGGFTPCCRFKGFPFKNSSSFAEAFASPEMQDIRTAMTNGERLPGCEKCDVQDAAGRKSLRQCANEMFGDVDEPELQSIELALGNLCNNSCIMCSSVYSTRWMSDEIALGLTPQRVATPDFESLLQGVDLSRLRYLKLIGGEPLLYEKTIVSILAQTQNLEYLELNTNTTLPLSRELSEVIVDIPEVRIALSIDAYGRRNEYIRHGSRWSDTEHIVEGFMKLPSNVTIVVGTVGQIANILYLDELESWLGRVGIKSWNVDTLMHPDFYDIRILPHAAKDVVSKKLKMLSHSHISEYLTTFLFSSDRSMCRPDFWKFTARLDRIRNQSFEDVFPEMADLLNTSS